MSDEKTPDIQAELNELNELVEQRRILDEVYEENTAEVRKRQSEARESIERLEQQIKLMDIEAQELDAKTYADLEDVRKRISQKMDTIKNIARGLPPEQLESTQRFAVEGGCLEMTISRVTPLVTYSPALLDELPELRDMKVDGDPVVREVIDPDILYRLIESGDVDEEVAKNFRITAKSKNPSVSIKEVEDG